MFGLICNIIVFVIFIIILAYVVMYAVSLITGIGSIGLPNFSLGFLEDLFRGDNPENSNEEPSKNRKKESSNLLSRRQFFKNDSKCKNQLLISSFLVTDNENEEKIPFKLNLSYCMKKSYQYYTTWFFDVIQIFKMMIHISLPKSHKTLKANIKIGIENQFFLEAHKLLKFRSSARNRIMHFKDLKILHNGLKKNQKSAVGSRSESEISILERNFGSEFRNNYISNDFEICDFGKKFYRFNFIDNFPTFMMNYRKKHTNNFFMVYEFKDEDQIKSQFGSILSWREQRQKGWTQKYIVFLYREGKIDFTNIITILDSEYSFEDVFFKKTLFKIRNLNSFMKLFLKYNEITVKYENLKSQIPDLLLSYNAFFISGLFLISNSRSNTLDTISNRKLKKSYNSRSLLKTNGLNNFSKAGVHEIFDEGIKKHAAKILRPKKAKFSWKYTINKPKVIDYQSSTTEDIVVSNIREKNLDDFIGRLFSRNIPQNLENRLSLEAIHNFNQTLQNRLGIFKTEIKRPYKSCLKQENRNFMSSLLRIFEKRELRKARNILFYSVINIESLHGSQLCRSNHEIFWILQRLRLVFDQKEIFWNIFGRFIETYPVNVPKIVNFHHRIENQPKYEMRSTWIVIFPKKGTPISNPTWKNIASSNSSFVRFKKKFVPRIEIEHRFNDFPLQKVFSRQKKIENTYIEVFIRFLSSQKFEKKRKNGKKRSKLLSNYAEKTISIFQNAKILFKELKQAQNFPFFEEMIGKRNIQIFCSSSRKKFHCSKILMHIFLLTFSRYTGISDKKIALMNLEDTMNSFDNEDKRFINFFQRDIINIPSQTARKYTETSYAAGISNRSECFECNTRALFLQNNLRKKFICALNVLLQRLKQNIVTIFDAYITTFFQTNIERKRHFSIIRPYFLLKSKRIFRKIIFMILNIICAVCSSIARSFYHITCILRAESATGDKSSCFFVQNHHTGYFKVKNSIFYMEKSNSEIEKDSKRDKFQLLDISPESQPALAETIKNHMFQSYQQEILKQNNVFKKINPNSTSLTELFVVLGLNNSLILDQFLLSDEIIANENKISAGTQQINTRMFPSREKEGALVYFLQPLLFYEYIGSVYGGLLLKNEAKKNKVSWETVSPKNLSYSTENIQDFSILVISSHIYEHRILKRFSINSIKQWKKHKFDQNRSRNGTLSQIRAKIFVFNAKKSKRTLEHDISSVILLRRKPGTNIMSPVMAYTHRNYESGSKFRKEYLLGKYTMRVFVIPDLEAGNQQYFLSSQSFSTDYRSEKMCHYFFSSIISHLGISFYPNNTCRLSPIVENPFNNSKWPLYKTKNRKSEFASNSPLKLKSILGIFIDSEKIRQILISSHVFERYVFLAQKYCIHHDLCESDFARQQLYHPEENGSSTFAEYKSSKIIFDQKEEFLQIQTSNERFVGKVLPKISTFLNITSLLPCIRAALRPYLKKGENLKFIHKFLPAYRVTLNTEIIDFVLSTQKAIYKKSGLVNKHFNHRDNLKHLNPDPSNQNETFDSKNFFNKRGILDLKINESKEGVASRNGTKSILSNITGRFVQPLVKRYRWIFDCGDKCSHLLGQTAKSSILRIKLAKGAIERMLFTFSANMRRNKEFEISFGILIVKTQIIISDISKSFWEGLASTNKNCFFRANTEICKLKSAEILFSLRRNTHNASVQSNRSKKAQLSRYEVRSDGNVPTIRNLKGTSFIGRNSNIFNLNGRNDSLKTFMIDIMQSKTNTVKFDDNSFKSIIAHTIMPFSLIENNRRNVHIKHLNCENINNRNVNQYHGGDNNWILFFILTKNCCFDGERAHLVFGDELALVRSKFSDSRQYSENYWDKDYIEKIQFLSTEKIIAKQILIRVLKAPVGITSSYYFRDSKIDGDKFKQIVSIEEKVKELTKPGPYLAYIRSDSCALFKSLGMVQSSHYSHLYYRTERFITFLKAHRRNSRTEKNSPAFIDDLLEIFGVQHEFLFQFLLTLKYSLQRKNLLTATQKRAQYNQIRDCGIVSSIQKKFSFDKIHRKENEDSKKTHEEHLNHSFDIQILKSISYNQAIRPKIIRLGSQYLYFLTSNAKKSHSMKKKISKQTVFRFFLLRTRNNRKKYFVSECKTGSSGSEANWILFSINFLKMASRKAISYIVYINEVMNLMTTKNIHSNSLLLENQNIKPAIANKKPSQSFFNQVPRVNLATGRNNMTSNMNVKEKQASPLLTKNIEQASLFDSKKLKKNDAVVSKRITGYTRINFPDEKGNVEKVTIKRGDLLDTENPASKELRSFFDVNYHDKDSLKDTSRDFSKAGPSSTLKICTGQKCSLKSMCMPVSRSDFVENVSFVNKLNSKLSKNLKSSMSGPQNQKKTFKLSPISQPFYNSSKMRTSNLIGSAAKNRPRLLSELLPQSGNRNARKESNLRTPLSKRFLRYFARPAPKSFVTGRMLKTLSTLKSFKRDQSVPQKSFLLFSHRSKPIICSPTLFLKSIDSEKIGRASFKPVYRIQNIASLKNRAKINHFFPTTHNKISGKYNIMAKNIAHDLVAHNENRKIPQLKILNSEKKDYFRPSEESSMLLGKRGLQNEKIKSDLVKNDHDSGKDLLKGQLEPINFATGGFSGSSSLKRRSHPLVFNQKGRALLLSRPKTSDSLGTLLKSVLLRSKNNSLTSSRLNIKKNKNSARVSPRSNLMSKNLSQKELLGEKTTLTNRISHLPFSGQKNNVEEFLHEYLNSNPNAKLKDQKFDRNMLAMNLITNKFAFKSLNGTKNSKVSIFAPQKRTRFTLKSPKMKEESLLLLNKSLDLKGRNLAHLNSLKNINKVFLSRNKNESVIEVPVVDRDDQSKIINSAFKEKDPNSEKDSKNKDHYTFPQTADLLPQIGFIEQRSNLKEKNHPTLMNKQGFRSFRFKRKPHSVGDLTTSLKLNQKRFQLRKPQLSGNLILQRTTPQRNIQSFQLKHSQNSFFPPKNKTSPFQAESNYLRGCKNFATKNINRTTSNLQEHDFPETIASLTRSFVESRPTSGHLKRHKFEKKKYSRLQLRSLGNNDNKVTSIAVPQVKSELIARNTPSKSIRTQVQDKQNLVLPSDLTPNNDHLKISQVANQNTENILSMPDSISKNSHLNIQKASNQNSVKFMSANHYGEKFISPQLQKSAIVKNNFQVLSGRVQGTKNLLDASQSDPYNLLRKSDPVKNMTEKNSIGNKDEKNTLLQQNSLLSTNTIKSKLNELKTAIVNNPAISFCKNFFSSPELNLNKSKKSEEKIQNFVTKELSCTVNKVETPLIEPKKSELKISMGSNTKKKTDSGYTNLNGLLKETHNLEEPKTIAQNEQVSNTNNSYLIKTLAQPISKTIKNFPESFTAASALNSSSLPFTSSLKVSETAQHLVDPSEHLNAECISIGASPSRKISDITPGSVPQKDSPSNGQLNTSQNNNELPLKSDTKLSESQNRSSGQFQQNEFSDSNKISKNENSLPVLRDSILDTNKNPLIDNDQSLEIHAKPQSPTPDHTTISKPSKYLKAEGPPQERYSRALQNQNVSSDQKSDPIDHKTKNIASPINSFPSINTSDHSESKPDIHDIDLSHKAKNLEETKSDYNLNSRLEIPRSAESQKKNFTDFQSDRPVPPPNSHVDANSDSQLKIDKIPQDILENSIGAEPWPDKKDKLINPPSTAIIGPLPANLNQKITKNPSELHAINIPTQNLSNVSTSNHVDPKVEAGQRQQPDNSELYNHRSLNSPVEPIQELNDSSIDSTQISSKNNVVPQTQNPQNEGNMDHSLSDIDVNPLNEAKDPYNHTSNYLNITNNDFLKNYNDSEKVNITIFEDNVTKNTLEQPSKDALSSNSNQFAETSSHEISKPATKDLVSNDSKSSDTHVSPDKKESDIADVPHISWNHNTLACDKPIESGIESLDNDPISKLYDNRIKTLTFGPKNSDILSENDESIASYKLPGNQTDSVKDCLTPNGTESAKESSQEIGSESGKELVPGEEPPRIPKKEDSVAYNMKMISLDPDYDDYLTLRDPFEVTAEDYEPKTKENSQSRDPSQTEPKNSEQKVQKTFAEKEISGHQNHKTKWQSRKVKDSEPYPIDPYTRNLRNTSISQIPRDDEGFSDFTGFENPNILKKKLDKLASTSREITTHSEPPCDLTALDGSTLRSSFAVATKPSRSENFLGQNGLKILHNHSKLKNFLVDSKKKETGNQETNISKMHNSLATNKLLRGYADDYDSFHDHAVDFSGEPSNLRVVENSSSFLDFAAPFFEVNSDSFLSKKPTSKLKETSPANVLGFFAKKKRNNSFLVAPQSSDKYIGFGLNLKRTQKSNNLLQKPHTYFHPGSSQNLINDQKLHLHESKKRKNSLKKKKYRVLHCKNDLKDSHKTKGGSLVKIQHVRLQNLSNHSHKIKNKVKSRLISNDMSGSNNRGTLQCLEGLKHKESSFKIPKSMCKSNLTSHVRMTRSPQSKKLEHFRRKRFNKNFDIQVLRGIYNKDCNEENIKRIRKSKICPPFESSSSEPVLNFRRGQTYKVV